MKIILGSERMNALSRAKAYQRKCEDEVAEAIAVLRVKQDNLEVAQQMTRDQREQIERATNV